MATICWDVSSLSDLAAFVSPETDDVRATYFVFVTIVWVNLAFWTGS